MFFQSEMNSDRGSVVKSEFAEPAKDHRQRQSIISAIDRHENSSKFSESERHAILSQNPSIELTESLFQSSNQTLRTSERAIQNESLNEQDPSEASKLCILSEKKSLTMDRRSMPMRSVIEQRMNAESKQTSQLSKLPSSAVEIEHSAFLPESEALEELKEFEAAERVPLEESEDLPYINEKTLARRQAKRNKHTNRRGIAPLLELATSSAQFIVDERPADSANHFQVSALLQMHSH